MTIETATADRPSADPSGRYLPGEPGVWLFILGDLMMFGLFFVTYVYYRAQDVVTYDKSQIALNETLGLTNTLALLTSSWFVALAVRAYRSGKGGKTNAPWLLIVAIFLGLCFVGIKFIEYGQKFGEGITILTNEFFMFYFMFTGIHLVHVLIGLGVLTWLFLISRRETANDGDIRTFEGAAAFWHLVDLLWVVLFALLYLMR